MFWHLCTHDSKVHFMTALFRKCLEYLTRISKTIAMNFESYLPKIYIYAWKSVINGRASKSNYEKKQNHLQKFYAQTGEQCTRSVYCKYTGPKIIEIRKTVLTRLTYSVRPVYTSLKPQIVYITFYVVWKCQCDMQCKLPNTLREKEKGT